MVSIRLQRIGKKNNPSFRLVVSDTKKDLYGPQLEILGNYNPVAKPKIINFDSERINYWLSVGAKTSSTVHNLLIDQDVIKGKKVRSWTPKKTAKQEKPSDSAPKEAAKAAPEKVQDQNQQKQEEASKNEQPS